MSDNDARVPPLALTLSLSRAGSGTGEGSLYSNSVVQRSGGARHARRASHS